MKNSAHESRPSLGGARLSTAALSALLGALIAVGGCHDASDRWEEPLEVSEAASVDGDLLYVHHTFEEVMRLSPEGGDDPNLAIDRVETGPRPGAHALSADESELYVVNRHEFEEDASLSVVDIEGESMAATTVELDSAYDRLSVDPEGDFLLLSFTGEAGDYIARNLNELGVLDLRDGLDEGDAAEFETLSSRARDIVFAPRFEMDGAEQRLAAALSPSEITIIDLLAERGTEDRLREVPLTFSEADRVQNPEEAFFVLPDEEGDPLRLYALTDTGEDITELTLKPGTERKFEITIDQLAAGNQPADMELLESEEAGSRLAVVDAEAAEFTLIDVDSGENATYELPMNAPAERVEPFEVSIDGETETRLLAWSTRTDLVAVIRPERIDIDEQSPTLGRSVEAIRLEDRPSHLQLAPDDADERAVARHGGYQGGLTVIDLRRNNAIPIQGATVNDVHFRQDRAYGTFRDEAYLGVIDLETGHPTPYRLPQTGRRIHVDDADDVIAVQHDDAGGTFTVLNAAEPTPDNARVFEDVFLYDLFEKEL